ncbi:hypothetical protein [Vitiosangium sp. GDMCC 1.1324]|uniref:hypothetical protein n=1 Tax=Vitiosangium sp. (strain GDMCC 1.1324) TaxID=2138576 RepID=UPI0018EEAECA|nr:hypothetical protein [Vitiosangium sp. GDMCC 1.1324]
MQPQQGTQTQPAVLPPHEVDTMMQQLRALFKDAPDYAKRAIEGLRDELSTLPETGVESAGRVGQRQGEVSELTLILPLVKGGAERLRGLFKMLRSNFQGADKVGSVHDMRFVFLDNDTKLLFATAYDGDWDPYIDDFVSKIPNQLDVLMSVVEGFPGIRSPKLKDFLVKHQVSADAWYVSNPHMTVSQARRLEKIDKALNKFLDTIS